MHVRTAGDGLTANWWGYITATTEALDESDFRDARILVRDNGDSVDAFLYGFMNTWAYTPLAPGQLAGNRLSANLVLDAFILPSEVIVAPEVPPMSISFSYPSGFVGTKTFDCSFRFGDHVIAYSVVVDFDNVDPLMVFTEGTRLDAIYDPFRITGVRDVGNDQGGQVRVVWQASTHEAPADPHRVTGYAVFRKQDEFMGAGSGDFAVAGWADEQQALRLLGWDYLATVPAFGDDGYQFVAPTLCDSTSHSNCRSTFLIRAMTAQPDIYFETGPESGCSVDNLAPGIPSIHHAAYRAGGVTLDWDDATEPDFRYYRIYRSESSDFTPSWQNLVHQTTTSAWVDSTASPWSWRYKVTTLDFAGNESAAGSPATVSGVHDHAIPASSVLWGAVPNPFNPSTTLSFDLAEPGRAKLKVYDAAGRLVVTLLDEHLGAGRHHIVWSGRDAAGVPSAAGLYFYRLEAGRFIQTKAMVLVK